MHRRQTQDTCTVDQHIKCLLSKCLCSTSYCAFISQVHLERYYTSTLKLCWVVSILNKIFGHYPYLRNRLFFPGLRPVCAKHCMPFVEEASGEFEADASVGSCRGGEYCSINIQQKTWI